MTDRELLEAAARAAGMTIEYWAQDNYPVVRDGAANVGWNPLVFDSDALRLAVKLGIQIGDFHQYGRALAFHGATRGAGEFWEVGEPESATRRAIVRAAAAMGADK